MGAAWHQHHQAGQRTSSKSYGFEAWHPDPSDLRALRTASDNIKKGIFEDETLPVTDDPYQELGNDDNLKEVD